MLGLALTADAVCDLLDDREAFLGTHEVNGILREEGLPTTGSLTDRRARLELHQHHTRTEIKGALGDSFKREKVTACIARSFEYVRLHSAWP